MSSRTRFVAPGVASGLRLAGLGPVPARQGPAAVPWGMLPQLALLAPLALAASPEAVIHDGPPPRPFEVGAQVTGRVPLVPCDQPLGTCEGAALEEGTRFVVAESRKADGRPWVSLRTQRGTVGWAPASAVTGATLSGDLDGDGRPDRVVARFTDATRVELLVSSGGRPPQRLDLGARSDIEGAQGTATVTVMPASEVGIPLVRVRWHAREQCGSGDAFAYASYQGDPPVLREALKHGGSGGDAPIWWETTAAFDPAAQTATVRFRAGEHGDDGSQGVHTERETVWRLRGGVYVERGD